MENIELALFILPFMCLSNSRFESIITPISTFLAYIFEFMDSFFFV